MMNRLINFVKNNKIKTLGALGIGSLLGSWLYARRGNKKPQVEPPQPTQPQTDQLKPTSKAPAKASTTQLATGLQFQNENIVGGFIPELIKLYQLSNALAVQYEQDANAFYQIYQTYEKKLEELLPVITVEMMKTPLSQMTAEDLPSKISTLFRYYSWDFAVQNFPKMLTGYYTLKMYNQKTENLTVNDLIAVADNPALAQNENMILLFQQIGELYKLKMQSALGQIGKLKDIYSFKLQTLKEQANMIKEMVKAILDQEALNFEKQYKIASLQQKERHFNRMMEYRWAQHNLAKQKLEQSLNTLPQINISGDEQ
jgi:hypothetical protein